MTRFRLRVIEYNDKLVLRRKTVIQQTRTGTYSQYPCRSIVQVNGLYSQWNDPGIHHYTWKAWTSESAEDCVFFCKSGSYPLLFTLLNGFSLGHTTTAYVTCLRPNAFQALRILLFRFFSAFVLNIKFWQFLSRFFVAT